MAHTHGPTCRLAEPEQPPSQGDKPPLARAQFFYSSPTSVDDPLSSGSLTSGPVESKGSRSQLRPFGSGDNNALEKAWLSLASDHHRKAHSRAIQRLNTNSSLSKEQAEAVSDLVRYLASKHKRYHGSEGMPVLPSLSSRPIQESGTLSPTCCPELYQDVEDELQQISCAVARRRQARLAIDKIVREVTGLVHLGQPEPVQPSTAELGSDNLVPVIPKAVPSHSRPSTGYEDLPRSSSRPFNPPDPHLPPNSRSSSHNRASRLSGSAQAQAVDDGISGKPFVRIGSHGSLPESPSPSVQKPDGDASGHAPDPGSLHTEPSIRQFSETGPGGRPRRCHSSVIVGASRLHKVFLPELHMKPIYWSPINDIAVVARATWFYKDTMLPVPTEVANQLEAGYEELRPWTETWRDELKCAVEVGPLGEEKVSHRLWPSEGSSHGKESCSDTPLNLPADPFCAARCFRGEVAAEGDLNINASGRAADAALPPPRRFASYDVIYKNAEQAFLLKPSLRPSAYYGRRPISKIMKGAAIGVPVVRGFDRTTWDAVNKVDPTTRKESARASRNRSGVLEPGTRDPCPACEADLETSRVRDLILVVHGIGQKYAERVESFHFTHAINTFRRSVNMELSNPLIKPALVDGKANIMVLPINWRHSLSFEDTDDHRGSGARESFGLKDIEPPTIPAIRGLISDVMFDIPFYMSQHKSKMILSLVSEANRVYRLWCENNPGFLTHGRVHLIAHSLGSVMALDILSRQPTRTPQPDLSLPPLQTECFDFDTTNLFLAGSPASFFLLLENGTLRPRRGRMKPGADYSDTIAKDIVGEAGIFGCLAVDNVYNILAKEDPIAYLLNSTIDPVYAAGLKTAYVPSATTSVFQTVGNAVRGLVPGTSPRTSSPAAQTQSKPSTVRLPSQLELEVHDFSREEIAEKKMYLLNDNGQIDYYLHSGGGPLEIKYLNMLSAHSSYWNHLDFVRMLCMEIGRKPGRANALPAMRAAKATKRNPPGTIG